MEQNTVEPIVYLIPTPLGDSELSNVMPATTASLLLKIHYYIVEDIRTARRFLKKVNRDTDIDRLTFFELNQHTPHSEIAGFLEPASQGFSIGVLSEAGCPGVADPGAEVVKIAHRKGIQVKPLVGPSSILLSLMASGMNGQNFAFSGYLPIRQPERSKKIKFLEAKVYSEDQTQVFIETPYRNNQLLSDLVKSLDEKTLLCVACDLSLDSEYIKTLSVGQWKKAIPDLDKRPAIFLIGK